MSGQVWFTADTHFGHKAMAADGKGWRPFATVAEHDEHLIAAWNAVVRPGDQVWHLGDVGLATDTHILACVDRLNGDKHLITGNHDAVWPGHRGAHKHFPTWARHFASISQYARRRIGRGPDFLLSHFPYAGGGDHTDDERHDEYRLRDSGLVLVHGHVHDAWARRGRQINVGVDVRDWTPVALETVANLVREASSE